MGDEFPCEVAQEILDYEDEISNWGEKYTNLKEKLASSSDVPPEAVKSVDGIIRQMTQALDLSRKEKDRQERLAQLRKFLDGRDRYDKLLTMLEDKLKTK